MPPEAFWRATRPDAGGGLILRARDIRLRVASALILAPAAIAATWAGGGWFLVLIALAASLMAIEWGLMSAPAAPNRISVAVGVALLAAIFATFGGYVSLALVLLVFSAVAAALFARRMGVGAIDAAYGVLYLGWPLILIIWLRGTESGFGFVVLLFAVVWASDSLAYVVGNILKGPKLWPRFSPNKTWSGFFGGLVAGMIAGALSAWWLDLGAVTPLWGAVLGLAAAGATMAGDLWESALKRRYGVKDAGALIPGHGGLLDRVDGLMFAVVVVAGARVFLIATGQG